MKFDPKVSCCQYQSSDYLASVILRSWKFTEVNPINVGREAEPNSFTNPATGLKINCGSCAVFDTCDLDDADLGRPKWELRIDNIGVP
jgi:hypothetical protein